MITETKKFVKAYGIPDDLNMPEIVHKQLKEECFYYIDNTDQGWLIRKSIPNLNNVEEIIHTHLKYNKNR